MSKSNGNDGGYDPTSVAAWREQTLTTIQLTDKLAVQVRMADVLMLLGDVNPLLQALQKMQGAEGDGMKVLQEPDALNKLTASLNDLLVKVMVSPPLVEQGHDPEEAISLAHIPLDYKIEIFSALIGGGDLLEKMQSFRDGPVSGVVAGRKGAAVSPETRGAADD
jgi:hypothetical protein